MKTITPLKDRIGAEIRTHYPENVQVGMNITDQEAWVTREGVCIELPDFVAETIERVAFLARSDKRVDHRSGVSQRMPITVMETVVSNAERRALRHGEGTAIPRIGDLYASLPAITGKMELEYEGELHGSEKIARELVQAAANGTFQDRAGGADTDPIVEYFESGGALQVGEDASSEACVRGFEIVPGLLELVDQVGLAPAGRADGHRVAACELVLESLVAERRVSRTTAGGYGRARHERSKGGGFQGFDPLGETT